MWSAISSILPLVLLIFKEVFSAQARAREKNEKFVLSQDALKAIVNTALEKQLSTMAKDSAAAGNAWDAADKDQAPRQ